MDELTFLVLKVIASISVALITTFVIPLLKSKLDEAKYQKLLDIIDVAVRAAEQAIGGSGNGPEKKAEVIRYVTQYLDNHHIDISEEQLNQLIEAAVFGMNVAKGDVKTKKVTKKAGGSNG